MVDVTDAPKRAAHAVRSTLPDRPICIAVNKIDQISPEALPTLVAGIGAGVVVIPTSALAGSGVESLRAEIGRLLFSVAQSRGSDLLALSNRQRGALRDAQEALTRARGICDRSSGIAEHAELLAIEVREAMNALSLLVGEVATEELLGRIFARFCIGK